MSGSLLQSQSLRSIPLDRDGWQTGFDSALFQGSESQSWTDGKPPIDEWQVAGSKRARRRKGTQEQANTKTEDQISPNDSGIFGSVVDLGQETSDRAQNGASRSNGTSSGSSSGAPTAASRSTTSAPTTQSPASSTIAFAPLSVDDDLPVKGKKAEKRKQKKKPKMQADSEIVADQAAGSQEDGVGAAPYKLPARFSDELVTHRDERQVELDILRSFVGPISASGGALEKSSNRQRRRQQLQDVVVGVLRRHPSLNYYQGYHDVISTLLLVLSPHHPTQTTSETGAWESKADFDLVLEAGERLTLFFLRDFMTKGIDPCMGWLKVLRNLLRQADPTFCKSVVEQASPLPFFALSWLITLLSHDLELGATASTKVFDFILVGGPETILWMIAALLLQSREELMRGDGMEEEEYGDPALLHHTLSKLPKQVTEGKTSIDDIVVRAKKLRKKVGGTNRARQGVMGSHSVMCTWSPLSAPPRDSTIAGTAGGSGITTTDWTSSYAQAEEYLSSSPDGLQKIVLDPTPSPPAEEEGAFDFAPDKKGRRHGSGGKPRDGKKPSSTSGGSAAATGAAVLVSVVVVAGAALFLGSHAMDRQQKTKLAHDLSDLGKGLVGLAFCAAGACQ